MKYRLTFKTPGVLDHAHKEAINNEDELAFKALTSRYIKYGEYVTLEFDTEFDTVRVVEIY